MPKKKNEETKKATPENFEKATEYYPVLLDGEVLQVKPKSADVLEDEDGNEYRSVGKGAVEPV